MNGGIICCDNCPTLALCAANNQCISAPPMGLMPQRVWVQQRVQDILQAMCRYHEAGMLIPEEWIIELSTHNQKT